MAAAEAPPPSALTFAVDRYGALAALTDVQEALGDDVTGRAAVQEEQVVVAEASVCEALGIVDLLVEPNDSADIVFAEVGKVGFRRVQRVACRGQHGGGRKSSGAAYYGLSRSPFSTLVLGWGPLKASSFLGTIQFRSPFSTRWSKRKERNELP